jgi:hypothetical protein
MPKVYIYVVARDFGFAPNPFHGVCTLATCKPAIRRTASVGDWIVGMAGTKLKAVGRCVFAMRVTETMSFDRYWHAQAFFDKRPVRNGSRRMMIGDNIYSRDPSDGEWRQADSHHSNPDGSLNEHNLARDTSTDRVLVSKFFFYFGSSAPILPAQMLSDLRYKNAVGHRVYPYERCREMVEWLRTNHGRQINQVSGLPFQFSQSQARYSVRNDKVSA